MMMMMMIETEATHEIFVEPPTLCIRRWWTHNPVCQVVWLTQPRLKTQYYNNVIIITQIICNCLSVIKLCWQLWAQRWRFMINLKKH